MAASVVGLGACVIISVGAPFAGCAGGAETPPQPDLGIGRDWMLPGQQRRVVRTGILSRRSGTPRWSPPRRSRPARVVPAVAAHAASSLRAGAAAALAAHVSRSSASPQLTRSGHTALGNAAAAIAARRLLLAVATRR